MPSTKKKSSNLWFDNHAEETVNEGGKMTTIVWQGILYSSIEYLQLLESEKNINVKSRITGTYEADCYFIEYNLNLDNKWKVYSFGIVCEVNNNKQKISGIKENNDWKINGTIDLRFKGYDFIDISLSPFTNSLPVNNLQLNVGQEKEIDVVYMDLLENTIKPVKQMYHRNTATNFKFENVPNDFEANIETDDEGLVIFYPSLFERLTKI